MKNTKANGKQANQMQIIKLEKEREKWQKTWKFCEGRNQTYLSSMKHSS